MIERTGFRERRPILSGLGLAVVWLLLASSGWAIDEEKTRVVRTRPSADSSGSERQASSTRSNSRSSVSPQRSTSSSSGSSSTAVQRQPTARDTRENPPGQWKPPGGSGGGGWGGGGYHPSWGGGWGYRYPWYWNRHCWGWPSCWGWGWGYWGPYWHYPPLAYSTPAYPLSRTPYSLRSASVDLGALNLVIKPKKAEVYVDGRFVGRAKDFDGYPGYLWLEEGSYEISLVRDGYVTFRDRIVVRTGNVMDVRLHLQPGLSTPAEVPRAPAAEPAPEAQEQLTSVQEEVPLPGIRQDVRADPGRLELAVQPSDASIYLDGRLLGSGQELADLHAGLIVDPGAHSLDMVRPGYEAQRLDFEVESGQTVSLQVTLQSDGR